MYHVRNVLLPFDATQQGDPRPRDVVLLSRDAHDADIRRRGVVFYCIAVSLLPKTRDKLSTQLVSEDATAPHPVSPKFARTLCLSADQSCLLVSSAAAAVGVGPSSALADVLAGQGMSSTRSQRFWNRGRRNLGGFTRWVGSRVHTLKRTMSLLLYQDQEASQTFAGRFFVVLRWLRFQCAMCDGGHRSKHEQARSEREVDSDVHPST